jgi:hypothetical protein
MVVSDQQSLLNYSLVLLSAGAVLVRQAVPALQRGSRLTHPIDAAEQNAADWPHPSLHRFSLFQLAHRQSCLSILRSVLEAEVDTGY